mmetsp:Transcript_29648/g.71738  ORF Transcript_29648/g.71738 Transcript_29648/m.71738 type:complete len:93 (+) Transcript_29648:151-429(+)
MYAVATCTTMTTSLSVYLLTSYRRRRRRLGRPLSIGTISISRLGILSTVPLLCLTHAVTSVAVTPYANFAEFQCSFFGKFTAQPAGKNPALP